MVWNKKVVPIAILVLLVAILSGLMASPALGQQPEKVKVLIGFSHQPGAAEQGLVHRAGGTIKYTYHLVPAIAASLPEAAIEGLLRSPSVVRIEPVITVYALDAELDNTWGVERIGAGLVHDEFNTGAGVKVAVIDSGIDYEHPDLDGNYVGGWDFVNGDNGPDGDGPMDDAGHGTHVAGTIAAEDNDVGVVGVAPGAALYALKVLGPNGGSYDDVIAAIEWAVGESIQVTNNSYGSAGDPGEIVKAAFDNAYAAGVLNVCAAGNSGDPPGRFDSVIYPARYESCIAVAATDQSDKRPRWSSTGPDVELAAPGVGINSTLLGGGYGEKSGTSMASPHVAGTAALVLAANPDWSNDSVRTQLQTTADDLGDPGPDTKYGFGLVDAEEAAPSTDTTPPAEVTGLTVTTVGCAQLDLIWDANAETDLDHYNVYRGTTSIGPYDLIASPTSYSYSDVGLTASITYYYEVSAVDVSGNEGEASDEASGTTSADNLGPVTSNVVADPNPTNGATSITLTADVDDSTTGNSNVAVAEYLVGAATPMSAWDGAFDSPTEGVIASIDVSDWAVGQYTLYVRGKDAAGHWGATESVVLDVTEAPSTIMYVESIIFSSKVAGPNKFLYTAVKVVDGEGTDLGGVSVVMELVKTGGTWDFAGITETNGTVVFTLKKALSGEYTATVMDLDLAPYTWSDTEIVRSVSWTLE